MIKRKVKNRAGGVRALPMLIIFVIMIRPAFAQETNHPPQPIDLPTALRLAGAQNLDVQIARERLAEAKANHQSATAQFFPWISAGIIYRQHDQNIQDVQGNIMEVQKYSYAPGGALNAQVDLGDAWFKSLAAKQVAQSAGHGLEAQRQEAVLAAAQGYFNLALAQGAAGVAAEAVRISGDYEEQVTRAAETGLAFKGDALRARVQTERNELALRQAREQQRIAGAQLARTLRLDPQAELVVQETELTPLNLITNLALSPLVARTLDANPDLKRAESLAAAARKNQSGAVYGPLVPTIGGAAFLGGLGGGIEGSPSTFGGQQDYFIGASWRIGPGGLFDFTRVRATAARLKAAELGTEKLKDELIGRVVEASTRCQSLTEQVTLARRSLSTATEALRLTRQRKEFGVGVVLENVQAEQDLTRARLDYLKVVAEFNKAQYFLLRAVGSISGEPSAPMDASAPRKTRKLD